MAEDFWQDDDLEYSGDFVADLDKIVEQHRSKLQVRSKSEWYFGLCIDYLQPASHFW